MKKVLFSLFIFSVVFCNNSIVLADSINRGGNMGYCMEDCAGAMGMTTEKCRKSCSASTYTEVGNCINSCNDSNCSKTCTSEYLKMQALDSMSTSSKITTCTSVCNDITGLGSEECGNWCTTYFSDSSEITRGQQYGNCMNQCNWAHTPGVKCEDYCAANTFHEVKDCLNSCDSDDNSCKNSCVSEYLDGFYFNSLSDETKQSTCFNVCRNMTVQGSEACNQVCENYLDGNDVNLNPDLKIWDRVQCGDLKMPYLFAVIINTVISFIKILVPIILVILGSLDLGKAVMAQKEDEIKKGQQVFVRRLVIGVILFVTFALVQLVISAVAPHNGNESMWDCIDCLVNKDCE